MTQWRKSLRSFLRQFQTGACHYEAKTSKTKSNAPKTLFELGTAQPCGDKYDLNDKIYKEDDLIWLDNEE